MIKKLFFWLCCISFFATCSDEEKANLLVTSKYDNQIIGQTMVYLVEGVNIDPNLELDKYSFSQRSDGTGQAYFKGLSEGSYTLYVYGFYDSKKVEGRQEIIIKTGTRNKISEVTIDLD